VAEEEIPPGGTVVAGPRWDPWRPEDVARRLSGVTVPWYVAGGWALDLLRGEQTREHGDLEGRAWPLDSPAFGVMHQTWVSEPGTGVYRLDIFREPQRDGAWVYRRDQAIRLPYEQVIRRTADGIPYLAPEIALLFKAKHSAEPKNQRDFAVTRPLLDDAAAGWLRQALARVHPGHAWISAVGRP